MRLRFAQIEPFFTPADVESTVVNGIPMWHFVVVPDELPKGEWAFLLSYLAKRVETLSGGEIDIVRLPTGSFGVWSVSRVVLEQYLYILNEFAMQKAQGWLGTDET